MKIIVIGGGASGMMCSINASGNGNEVILLEKNEKLGKKIYITGKGRCNLTNDSDVENILANTIGNPYFLYSSLYSFTSQNTMEFFENLGVPLKVERGNRVFPVSDKSNDIIKAFERGLRESGVKVKLNSEVSKLLIENEKICGVLLSNGTLIECDKVVIATGGLSYPSTGSTGDGYKFARETNHNVTKLYPSLVPLVTKNKDVFLLQGLSLKNIGLRVLVDKKELYNDFGEMMFTHYGITGPLILKASRYLVGNYNKNIIIEIDLKPALSEKELDTRVLKDFEMFKNKSFKNSLDKLLPQKIIPIIIKHSGIDENKSVNEITKVERKKLIDTIKSLKIDIFGNTGYRDAVITSGGVDVKDIDPSTMESKIIENLYFTGEVIDIDCFTGGYNLQIAFSTGYLAGKSILESSKES